MIARIQLVPVPDLETGPDECERWNISTINPQTKWFHQAALRQLIQRAHKSRTSEAAIKPSDFSLMIDSEAHVPSLVLKRGESLSGVRGLVLLPCAALQSETGDSLLRCQVQGSDRTTLTAHYSQPAPAPQWKSDIMHMSSAYVERKREKQALQKK